MFSEFPSVQLLNFKTFSSAYFVATPRSVCPLTFSSITRFYSGIHQHSSNKRQVINAIPLACFDGKNLIKFNFQLIYRRHSHHHRSPTSHPIQLQHLHPKTSTITSTTIWNLVSKSFNLKLIRLREEREKNNSALGEKKDKMCKRSHNLNFIIIFINSTRLFDFT